MLGPTRQKSKVEVIHHAQSINFTKIFFDQPFPDQSNSILQVCLNRLKMDEKSTSKLLEKVFNFWTVNYEHKIIVLRTIHDLTKTGEEERPKWIHRHFQQNRFVPKKDKRNLSKNARPYGTHCEQFVSKDDIQKYVSNICVHMLHTNQFKVDPAGCPVFRQLSHQLQNFCRQVYINPQNIKISKYNVLIATCQSSASLNNHVSVVVEYRKDIFEHMLRFTAMMLELLKFCDSWKEVSYDENGQPRWKRQLAPPDRNGKKTIIINQDEATFNVNDNDTGVWTKGGRGRDREKGKGESTWVVAN